MGEISLRRRFDPSLRADVYEVKLGDEHVMSSLFTVAEKELARLGLARTPGTALDVIVGGLGLGYTAQEALQCSRIRSSPSSSTPRRSSTGITATCYRTPPVWPPTAGSRLGARRLLRRGDGHGRFRSGKPRPNLRRDPARHRPLAATPAARSTRPLLHPRGAAIASTRLAPGGAFAMWSDDPPDDDFTIAAGQPCSPMSRRRRSGSTIPSPAASQPPRSTSRPDRRAQRLILLEPPREAQRKRTSNVARPKILRPSDFAATTTTPVRVAGSSDLIRPLNSMSAPSVADTIAGADSRTA